MMVVINYIVLCCILMSWSQSV